MVLAMHLFFMRLHLFAVNGKAITGSEKVYFLFCSAIFLTSATNVALATRRNVCLGTVGNAFICIRKGVVAPRRTTSEPCEHSFGCDRTFIREFTVCESCNIQEKKARKLHAIFASGLRTSREPKKGYQATFDNFTEAHTEDEFNDTTQIEASTAKELFKYILPIINEASKKMKVILDHFQVREKDRSPLAKKFESFNDFRNTFMDFVTPKMEEVERMLPDDPLADNDADTMGEGGETEMVVGDKVVDVERIKCINGEGGVDLGSKFTLPDDCLDGDCLSAEIYDNLSEILRLCSSSSSPAKVLS